MGSDYDQYLRVPCVHLEHDDDDDDAQNKRDDNGSIFTQTTM